MGEPAPSDAMLPLDSTFVLEHEGKPFLAVTMYLTNSKEFCMLDNFIGNPELSGPLRRDFTRLLLNYCEGVAIALGYKKIFCMATNEKLAAYYEGLGFTPTCNTVTTFIKTLERSDKCLL